MSNGHKDTATEYFSIKSLAKYCDTSERTIRTHVNKAIDPIPSYRIGRLIRIKRSEFDAWMKLHKRNEAIDIGEIVKEVLVK